MPIELSKHNYTTHIPNIAHLSELDLRRDRKLTCTLQIEKQDANFVFILIFTSNRIL